MEKIVQDAIHADWVALSKKFISSNGCSDLEFKNAFEKAKKDAKEAFQLYNPMENAWATIPYIGKIILIGLAFYYSTKLTHELRTIKAIIANNIVEAISCIDDPDNCYRCQEYKKFYFSQLEKLHIPSTLPECAKADSTMYNRSLLLGEEEDYVKGAVFDTISKSFYLIISDNQKYYHCCEDLATVLQILIKNKTMDVSFSLDPSDPLNPFEGTMKKVYYPPEMEGTNVGYSFWLADWVLKQMTQGEEYNDTDRYSLPLSIKSKLPGYKSLLDMWSAEVGETKEHRAARIWVVIKDVKSSQEVSNNRISLLVNDVSLGIRAKCIMKDPTSKTGLKDVDLTGSSAEKFASYLESNIKTLESHYAHFRRLRNLAAIIAIAKWLRDDIKLPPAMFNFDTICKMVNKYGDDYPKEQVPRLSAKSSKIVDNTIYTTSIIGGIDFSLNNHKPAPASSSHINFINYAENKIKSQHSSSSTAASTPENKVDYKFIAKLEGESLKGYVPTKNGKAIGQSGVSIVNGVDLGQMNLNDLKKFNLSPSLEQKCTPYLMKKKEEAITYLAAYPLVMTHDEGSELKTKVNEAEFKAVRYEFNKNKSPSTPEFQQLTQAQQTVLFSLKHHTGSICNKSTMPAVSHALKNDWTEFRNQLEKITPSFSNRRREEMKYLEANSGNNIKLPEKHLVMVKFDALKDPVCTNCSQPVNLGINTSLPYQVYVNSMSNMSIENKLYCKAHHPLRCHNDHCKQGGICTSGYVEANKMKYHHDCFCCTGCGGKIEGSYVNIQGKSGMYHKGCAK